MFKIGEFSKLTQVSIRMLRYYDETGLLKPDHIDRFTNYRYYSAKQIPALNKIIFLRDLGFNVAEISIALKQWDDQFIIKQLEQRQLEIMDSIKAEQEKLAKIELAKKDIGRKKIAIHYNVSIKSIPSYQVFSLRRIVPDYYAEGDLWKEMSAYAQKNHIQISDNTFTIYHGKEYKEKDVDIEVCVPVAKMEKGCQEFVFRNTEPIPLMACTMVYGPFSNIAGAFSAFANWLEMHNQYQMDQHSRQIVHRGPWNENNPQQFLTEIQIPLKTRSAKPCT